MTTVADVVADGLARAGTARVFVVAGDRDSEPIVDAVERRGLPVARVDRPDVACVMAAVSGSLTGTPGAAVIGRERGGAAAGLAYASFDRAPAVVISIGVPLSETEAVTKAALSITPGSAAHWIAHACQLAMKEPWGPVRLDLPPATITAPALPVATSCRPGPLAAPDPGALDAAVRLIDASEHTLVVVGGLCRSETDAAWIRPFVEARPAPVLATPKARGVVPDPHPLVIGTLDGGDAERRLLADADLVVAIGVDPREAPNGWPADVNVLELTPAAPESPSDDRVTVVGDLGLILEELAPRLRGRRSAEWDVARLHALKQAASAPPTMPRDLAAHRVVEAARRLTPAGTVAVFEHGDVWRHAARAWHAVAPGECRMSAAATEGFATVAAAAARLARPEQRVVCFTESRALRHAPNHLAVVAAFGGPVLIVVVADEGSPFTPPPNFRGFNATSIASFAGLFETALGAGAPAVVSVAGP
ncbi:MAG TPA: thiamine pyrophosphate-binding protein [Candidatus Acidoferrum sp.]|nr:thiamine pyrophosphate-binding protein [Candidatus Acidoferrum sp.]